MEKQTRDVLLSNMQFSRREDALRRTLDIGDLLDMMTLPELTGVFSNWKMVRDKYVFRKLREEGVFRTIFLEARRREVAHFLWLHPDTDAWNFVNEIAHLRYPNNLDAWNDTALYFSQKYQNANPASALAVFDCIQRMNTPDLKHAEIFMRNRSSQLLISLSVEADDETATLVVSGGAQTTFNRIVSHLQKEFPDVEVHITKIYANFKPTLTGALNMIEKALLWSLGTKSYRVDRFNVTKNKGTVELSHLISSMCSVCSLPASLQCSACFDVFCDRPDCQRVFTKVHASDCT